MVESCVAQSCNNTHLSGLSVHLFPTTENGLQWIHFVQVKRGQFFSIIRRYLVRCTFYERQLWEWGGISTRVNIQAKLKIRCCAHHSQCSTNGHCEVSEEKTAWGCQRPGFLSSGSSGSSTSSTGYATSSTLSHSTSISTCEPTETIQSETQQPTKSKKPRKAQAKLEIARVSTKCYNIFNFCISVDLLPLSLHSKPHISPPALVSRIN
jgi:hypothetical protein